jgi:hypothetical protein
MIVEPISACVILMCYQQNSQELTEAWKMSKSFGVKVKKRLGFTYRALNVGI